MRDYSFFSTAIGELDHELEWVSSSVTLNIYSDCDQGKWRSVKFTGTGTVEEDLNSIEDWIAALQWFADQSK